MRLTEDQRKEAITALTGDNAALIGPLQEKIKQIDIQIKALVIDRAETKKLIAKLSDKNRRYNKGDNTVTAIAERLGVHPSTISRLRPKLPAKKPRPNPEREPKFTEDFEDF